MRNNNNDGWRNSRNDTTKPKNDYHDNNHDYGGYGNRNDHANYNNAVNGMNNNNRRDNSYDQLRLDAPTVVQSEYRHSNQATLQRTILRGPIHHQGMLYVFLIFIYFNCFCHVFVWCTYFI